MEISSLLQHQHNKAMPSSQPVNMEEVMRVTATGTKSADQSQERKPRPQPEQALKCPRCESTNTKFCYYNNYSLSQPRYFCKGCRRYWTQGGSLRNVPVGGGCRKNTKRSSSSSSKKPHDHHHQTLITPSSLPILPPLPYAPVDGLSLPPFLNPNPNPSSSFLDILRSGFLDTASPAGFSNLCSGYGYDAGLGLSCPATATTTTAAADGDQEMSKMAMGHQCQLSDGSDNSSSYYNWHGIINSSLM